MCESSKSERPELESGHLQETDRSGKKVSRRSFLGGMALGAGCLGFGNFIGEVIKDLGSEKVKIYRYSTTTSAQFHRQDRSVLP